MRPYPVDALRCATTLISNAYRSKIFLLVAPSPSYCDGLYCALSLLTHKKLRHKFHVSISDMCSRDANTILETWELQR